MSSWIPSLFNPFTDDDNPTSPQPSSPPRSPSSGAIDDLKKGAIDDLSTVFHGVAAFLAPPPAASSPGSSSSETILGMKSDLAEIQGTFRSGLSLISSKITSNLLQLQNQLNDGDENDDAEEEDGDDEGLGITEKILDFVMKISRRPELWTDFPLSLPDDFHMSNYQEEHAANIDHLVPEFETLRQNICSQMSNGKFWFIYFILLLPRLNGEDLKLLSTPQVAEAREALLNKLQDKTHKDTYENPESSDAKDISVDTVNPTQQRDTVDETDPGHQPNEADTHASVDTQKQSLNEEDVSFGDLEEDIDDTSDKISENRASSSDKDSVQVEENQKADNNGSKDKESEGEDSNDWLTVDETDFDNLGQV